MNWSRAAGLFHLFLGLLSEHLLCSKMEQRDWRRQVTESFVTILLDAISQTPRLREVNWNPGGQPLSVVNQGFRLLICQLIIQKSRSGSNRTVQQSMQARSGRDKICPSDLLYNWYLELQSCPWSTLNSTLPGCRFRSVWCDKRKFCGSQATATRSKDWSIPESEPAPFLFYMLYY